MGVIVPLDSLQLVAGTFVALENKKQLNCCRKKENTFETESIAISFDPLVPSQCTTWFQALERNAAKLHQHNAMGM